MVMSMSAIFSIISSNLRVVFAVKAEDVLVRREIWRRMPVLIIDTRLELGCHLLAITADLKEAKERIVLLLLRFRLVKDQI